MEALWRFSVFIGILLMMLTWETLRPCLHLNQPRKQRWSINLGLALLNVAVMRLSMGAAALQAAIWASEQHLGLFNQWSLPGGITLLLSLLLLDLAIYAQHIAAHRWRWFWCLHQVHHSDMDFDTTTAMRFHPLEIILSMLYKVLLVLILGVAPFTVILFEMILNGCALFNHGNVNLPPFMERSLRYFLVTPDMHRIHHSAYQPETDSNFGFSLSCWDRLFKTYCSQPKAEFRIGLNEVSASEANHFLRLLSMPFRSLRPR